MFVQKEFRQRMDKIYAILSDKAFDEGHINALITREPLLIQYLTSEDIDVSMERILPVIPDVKTIDEQLRLVKSNFLAFSSDKDVCKEPLKDCPKIKKPSFLGEKDVYLEFFQDIPKVPKAPYFIILDNRMIYAPASPAYLRNEAGKTKEQQDKLITMFEALSFIIFGRFAKILEGHNFESSFILNSFLAQNDEYRIILRIINDNGCPKLTHYKEFINDMTHNGYDHYSGTVNNMTWKVLTRI